MVKINWDYQPTKDDMVIFGDEPLYTSGSVQPFASLTGLSTPRGECENRAAQWTGAFIRYDLTKPPILKAEVKSYRVWRGEANWCSEVIYMDNSKDCFYGCQTEDDALKCIEQNRQLKGAK